MQLKIKRLHKDAILPQYQTKGSAGFDLHTLEEAVINPGDTILIRTGLSFEIPEGYELEIRPRSGNSLKTKLRLSNSPGTIDSDYRGEVQFIVDNIMTKHPERAIVPKGTRLGQALLKKVEQAEIIEIEELSETERGTGGFGSTGL